MKQRINLALQSLEKRPDIANPVHQNIYGEGFLAGFEMAIQISKQKDKLKGSHIDEAKSTTKVIRRRSSS